MYFQYLKFGLWLILLSTFGMNDCNLKTLILSILFILRVHYILVACRMQYEKTVCIGISCFVKHLYVCQKTNI